MASRRAKARLAKLWQMPLLLASLGLFGYAAYLFIDPKPRITVAQRIEAVEALLKKGRCEAALEQGNKLLASASLKSEDEGRIHLLLAEALETAQKQKHLRLDANYTRIIEQTKLAVANGVTPTVDLYRRWGESLEALDHPLDALQAYRQAVKLDKKPSPVLQRRIIELELGEDDPAPAEASINEYLKATALSNVDRAWALIIKARALIKRNQFADAMPVLDEAMRLDPAVTSQGIAHYWIGLCTWKLGKLDEADRVLRVARDQLKIGHPLDAEAAYALGQIRLEKNDPRVAASFFQSIITSHPESRAAPLARLRRGFCRVEMDEDEAGLSDLHDVVRELGSRKDRESYTQEAVAGLRQASNALAVKKNFAGSLEVMTDEQTLTPEPPAEFFARLASVFERRADQVESTIASAPDAAEKAKREQQVTKLRIQAGDAYIALSGDLTLADDRGQGDAMWKGVELYDRAGATFASISAMEKFVADHPDDPTTPDALLRLGKAYQATGQFDKAIKKLQWNQFRHPQSLAATKSGVPLAQAYIAKGPEAYPKAEKVLLAVIENNPIITPEAEEFRQALFELAQLYYRTGRYEDAISRLEEATARYPTDARMGQIFFLMADSYRKSAMLLSEKIRSAQSATPGKQNAVELAAAANAKAEAIAARHDRLVKAKGFFDRVVAIGHDTPPTSENDKLYLKLAHFYRADCLYDLHQYEEAIRLYDSAALRYQDDPSSVSAYVQIVNAYCAMGRLDDARTANERAKWLVRKMPAGVFDEGKSSMPKKYWDDWLRLTAESGIYTKDLKSGPLSDAR